ncbi:MAG: hypothetical protein AMXMBFR82_12830 [Candidatus Hydrogenedentota bacterium]
MDLNEMDDMDRMIEEALRSEPMRNVPQGFHLRMSNRLHVTALVQNERQGFRFRMMATAAVFAILGAAIVGVPALAFYQGWGVQAVPGAMGYFDYLVVFAFQYWGEIVIALSATTLLAGLATATGWALVRLRQPQKQS